MINLKRGAQGKPQRQIRLQRERFEAMTAIAKGWKANGRTESGSGHGGIPVFLSCAKLRVNGEESLT